MKKYLFILFISFFSSLAVFAQDEQAEDKGGRLQERMQLYIQKRLNMTKTEAQRFSPIFIRYITELRRTHRENSGDRPVLQLRIAEVRVKFRNEFRQVIDEQRANKIFQHQREFEEKIRQEIIDRRQDRQGGARRNR